MASKQKVQPDYGAAIDLFVDQLKREAEKYQVPILQDGRFTGEFYDTRLGELPSQPQPKRFMEHIAALRQRGVQPLQVGQPVPGFQIQDPYQSEGLLDSISKTLKLGYNKSLSNLATQALIPGEAGKDAFNLGGFEPSKLEDIASDVLSFFSPVDLVALVGGGGVGGFAVKTLAKKAIAKGLAKGLTQELAEKAAAKSLLQIIPRSAGALGVHSGAAESLREKVETGELKLETFLEGVAKGGLLGAAVGGTGGIAGQLTSTLSKPLQAAIGLTAETFALGTASPFIYEARSPKLEDYEHAASFIVGLKLVGGVPRLARSAYERFRGSDPAAAEVQLKAERDRLKNQSFKDNQEFNEAVGGYLIKTAEASARVFEDAFASEKERVAAQTPAGRAGLLEKLGKEADLAKKVDEYFIKETPVLLPEKTGRPETPIFGEGFTARPSLPKEKFLKRVGSEIANRKLSRGETVEMDLAEATRVFGEEALRGRKPAKVLLAQAEDGGKVLMHQIFKSKGKGKTKAGLNILSVDNAAAFDKAMAVSRERKVPLSISAALRDKPIFKALQQEGLIGDIPEGQKFVRVKLPETALKEINREEFKRQMNQIPDVSKEQVEAAMAIVDARAESAGVPVDTYLRQRFPVKAIISKSDQLKKQLAQTSFLKDGKAVITAFKQADVSSIVHELGHVFRRDLAGDELAVASKWAGAKDGKWTRAAEEKFARGFEKYLRDGEAPTPELRTVFQKFKDWLTKIYEKLNELVFPEISPEMRSVYNLLLSPKGEAEKVEPAVARAKSIEQTLFQERVNAKKLGQPFVDRFSKTVEAIVPDFLKRVSKRVTEPESKEIISRANDGTFRHHKYFNAYEEETIRLGLDKIKTKAEGEQLGLDIRSGKATGYNKLMADVFRRYKEAGGEAGEVKPETAGEFYFRRQLKADIQERVYEQLEAFSKDLGNIETVTDEKIRSALVARSKEFQQGINHILKKAGGETKGLRELLKITERDVTRRFTTDAGWEKQRTILEWPENWYETDAREVLPRYLDSMAKRTAELEVFGKNDEIGVKLLSKLEDKNFEEYKVMRKALSMWSGQYDITHGFKGKARQAVDAYVAFEVGSKIGLGFGTLLNTSQWVISFMPKVGFWQSVGALGRVFDPAYRKQLRETGILRNSDMQALAMTIGREQLGGKIPDWFARMTVKASGFSAINRLNLYWAASALDGVLPKWLEKAKGSGRGAEIVRKTLGDLGIDWKKPLSDVQRQKAIFEFATNSQLQKNVFEEPLYLNEPYLRPLLLFKRFGLRQFNWMKDMLTTEISRGNYMPLIRFGVVGYLSGAGVVWAMNKIKEMLSGEEQFRRDDGFVNNAIQNFAVIGAFGLVSDMLELERISKLPNKIKFVVEPVLFSDIGTFYDGMTRFLEDWERYGDGWLATKRNAYSVFNLFGSLPRHAGKQLLTPIQQERRLAYQKGIERKEIFELLLNGKGDRAADRVANWNRANKENLIEMQEVSLREVIKYLERLAESRAGAVGEKGTPEFKKAFRQEKKEVRERVQKELTPEERREFREKLKLLREKYKPAYQR